MDKLPNKWKIKVTEENLDEISKYFHSIGNQYIGYNKIWWIDIDQFIVYPQHSSRGWGYTGCFDVPHKEITFEDFKKLILNKEVQYEIY